MGRNIVAKALIPAITIALGIAVKSTSVTGQTESTELAQLRLRLALKYLEPDPLIAIARYFWARGDRLQAFYLLEYARRARFPAKQFDLLQSTTVALLVGLCVNIAGTNRIQHCWS